MRTKRMSFGFGLLTALIVLGLTAAPAFAGQGTDLAGRAQAWEDAFNAGDAGSIAALYTDDALRMPYQAPTVEGRDGIIANINATLDMGIVAVDLEVLGDETSGNMAWGHGTYALMDADGNTVQSGKWMNVSKKVNGTWMIHCDIWNTDEPDE